MTWPENLCLCNEVRDLETYLSICVSSCSVLRPRGALSDADAVRLMPDNSWINVCHYRKDVMDRLGLDD